MKKLSKLILATVSLTVLFSVLTVAEAKAQVLQEILKRMETYQKSLYSLRSKFTKEDYNAQLQESDFKEGTSIYLRGVENKAWVRIDWTKPVAESLAFADGKYMVYRPRLRQAIVGKIDKAKGNDEVYNALSFLGKSKKELKASFIIMYLGAEKIKDGTETFHLKFIPRQPTVYQSVEMWMNKDGMPLQAKVLEANGDATTVFLYDFRKNATMNGREFPIQLPKGTTIINAGGGGCLCFKPDGAADALKNWSDVVFSGKITAVSGTDYTFKTERLWKGAVGGEVVVRNFSTADCAAQLTVGKRYIVFAKKTSVKNQTVLGLMPCSLTTDIGTEKGGRILTEIGEGKPLKTAAVGKKRPPVQKISPPP